MAKPNDVTLKVGVDDTDLWSFANKAMPQLGKILSSRGGLVKGAIGAAFFLAASAISDAISKMEEFIKKLQEVNRKSGADPETLQGWNKAAEKFGGNMDTVSAALEKFSLTRAKALEQGPEGKERKAFERLGISTTELGAMSDAQGMLLLQQRVQELGGTSNNILPLTDLFGKMSKDLEFLNENLDEMKNKLKDLGGTNFISNRQSEQIELLRKQSEEMGFGKTLFGDFSTPENLSLLKGALVDAKAIFKLFDDIPKKGLSKAFDDFTDVFTQQFLTGMRGGIHLTTKEQEAIGDRNRQRQKYREDLLRQIQDLDEELQPKFQKAQDLREKITKKEAEVAKLPKGSTKQLEALRDVRSMTMDLRKLEGEPEGLKFGSNPFLQIGGLLGIDINTRILNANERTANNTAIIAEAVSKNTPPPQTPSDSPLVNYAKPSSNLPSAERGYGLGGGAAGFWGGNKL